MKTDFDDWYDSYHYGPKLVIQKVLLQEIGKKLDTPEKVENFNILLSNFLSNDNWHTW